MLHFRNARLTAIGIVMLLSLVGCADSTAQPQASTASTASTASSPSSADQPTAVPELGFAPILALEERSIGHQTSQAEVYAHVRAPVITGVKPEVAELFSNGYEALLEEDMLLVAQQIESHLPSAKHYCEETGSGKCGSEVRVEVTQAQVFKHYATISYEFGMNILGGMPSTLAKSLTIDLQTGAIVGSEEFLDSPRELIAAALPRSRCMEDYGIGRDAQGTVEAFSPTDDGLYLSWAAGSFSAVACGVAQVVIPWEQQPPETSATPSAAEERSGQETTSCAGNPALPPGIDPRICSPAPDSARALPPGEYGGALVFTPSQNIWCSFSQDELDCARIDPYARIGLGSSGKAAVPNRDDGPSGETPVTLAYDEVATFGSFACVAQEIGLACWNTATQHGLFLSRQQTLMW